MKRLIFLSTCWLVVFTFILSLQSRAQALNTTDIKAQMVKDWERAKAYTVDYLNTMPADKYSFKAVDSIRSFAQQMLHLASGNVFLMSAAISGAPLPWLMGDIEHSAGAQKKTARIKPSADPAAG